MSTKTIKAQIAQLESEILQLLRSSLPVAAGVRSKAHKIPETIQQQAPLPRGDMSRISRTKKDRRGEDDRRGVSDLSYFKHGGEERRTYSERRNRAARRASQPQRKHKGLTKRLWG